MTFLSLMRQADVPLLPSIEEGFGLVCVDTIGAGCVPLVSKACTDTCKHMQNALVHEVGDVSALREHISLCFGNPELLGRLRDGALCSRNELTWTAAGQNLLGAYEAALRSVLQ